MGQKHREVVVKKNWRPGNKFITYTYEARAAATQLPAEVQQMEPWAKSFASVQSDINSQ